MNAFAKLAILNWTKKPAAERLAQVRATFTDRDSDVMVSAIADSLPPACSAAFLVFVRSLKDAAV